MACPERCDSKSALFNTTIAQYTYTYALGEVLRKLNVLIVAALVLFVYLL